MATLPFLSAGDAFEHARRSVSEHTDKMALANATWREETATELVLASTYPTIRFADFNRGEEAETGADWLWWWLAPGGEAFGALVQAKKITFTGAGTPKIDWRHSKGRQLGDLNRAATRLGVPALYAIYFGGLGYRSGWPCRENPPGCLRCAQLAITLLPTLILSGSPAPTAAAVLADTYGIPLEHLDGGAAAWGPPLAPVTMAMRDDLRELLTTAQYGARAVAQAVTTQVMRFRRTQFNEQGASVITAESGEITQDRVFVEVPDDRLHNNNVYFETMLRGLRRTPPGYVLDILNGETLPEDLLEQVDGVGVIQIDG